MVLLLLTSFNVFPFPQKQLKLNTVTKAHLSLNITEDKTTMSVWVLGKQVLFLFDSSYIQ